VKDEFKKTKDFLNISMEEDMRDNYEQYKKGLSEL
jgi:hypothetical protein